MKPHKILILSAILLFFWGCEFSRSIEINIIETKESSNALLGRILRLVEPIRIKYELKKRNLKKNKKIFLFSKKVNITTVSILIDGKNSKKILISISSFPKSKMHALVPKIASDIEKELKLKGIKFTTTQKSDAIDCNVTSNDTSE